MNIGNIYKESLHIIRQHFIIVVPPIVVSIILAIVTLVILKGSIFTTGEVPDMKTPAETLPSVRDFMGIAFIIGIISFLLQALSHGMILSMANEAIEKGTCSLQKGFQAVLLKLNHLMIAAAMIGILFVIGMMLFFFPAFIVSFIFMFTFVIIISEDIGALDAMKKSYRLVKENLSQSFILFVALVGTGFLITIINMVFGLIPVLGQIINVVLMGIFLSFVAIALLRSYRELQKEF